MSADELAGAREFVRLVGNLSKYDYTNDRHHGSVFIYEDAILADFLVSCLGNSLDI